MFKLIDVAFPHKYLNCYEAALVTILKYLGLVEEAPLMGTQAYLVLREGLNIFPRFNTVDEEWKRVHGLSVKSVQVNNDVDLGENITDRLRDHMPLCLPVDIFYLSHTPHYNHLHQCHYVDIWGYDDSRYYIVCPYYRFRGWIEAEVIHCSFFSSAIDEKKLNFVPELKLETLTPEKIYSLIQENSENMLGLRVPASMNDVNSQYLGLTGIRTLSHRLQELMADSAADWPYGTLLNLSRQMRMIGYSRYWFHQLIKTCQDDSLQMNMSDGLQEQFTRVAQLWNAIGMRLGAGVHKNDREMVSQSALQLEDIYIQELQLFNRLLAISPDYESGIL